MKQVFHGDCLDLLDLLSKSGTVPLIIADPPDNLGLAYDGFKDKRPAEDYYNFLELMIRKSLRVADTFWLSYYWEHDLEIKARVRYYLKYERPSVKAKTFIWRYTFGQYKDTDCGSGFRYLLRFTKPNSKMNVDSIRVPSTRMKLGDSRASGPKVPDDVWDIPGIFDEPRVNGNCHERRDWHPTQHPEALYERIINFNSDPGDTVVDLFGGTGTLFRTAPKLGRKAVISEISDSYVEKILAEHTNAHRLF